VARAASVPSVNVIQHPKLIPVSPVPKGARRGGTGTAWKVFARHQEVADPPLVLLRVKNSGFASVGEADIRRPITFTFPGREVPDTGTLLPRINTIPAPSAARRSPAPPRIPTWNG
jgi:hypothetical protein